MTLDDLLKEFFAARSLVVEERGYQLVASDYLDSNLVGTWWEHPWGVLYYLQGHTVESLIPAGTPRQQRLLRLYQSAALWVIADEKSISEALQFKLGPMTTASLWEFLDGVKRY